MTTSQAQRIISDYLHFRVFSFMDAMEYLDSHYAELPDNVRNAYDLVIGEMAEVHSQR